MVTNSIGSHTQFQNTATMRSTVGRGGGKKKQIRTRSICRAGQIQGRRRWPECRMRLTWTAGQTHAPVKRQRRCPRSPTWGSPSPRHWRPPAPQTERPVHHLHKPEKAAWVKNSCKRPGEGAAVQCRCTMH